MSRNSSGVYSLPAGNPVVSGTIIEVAWANPTMSDIAQALTDSLPRNGAAPMVGPLVLSGNATLALHATPLQQVQSLDAAVLAAVIATFAPLASPVFTGNPTAPTPAVGDSDTSLATTAFVRNAYANGFGGGGFGFKNKLINGAFSIWQRGLTVSSGVGVLTYTADRWITAAAGAAVSVGRTSGDGNDQYALAITGAGGNTSVNVTQRIEAANCFIGAGTVFTVAGKIFSNAGVTPAWQVDSADSVDNFAATTIVAGGSIGALAAGWQDFSFTFTTNAACQNGMQVQFIFGAIGAGETRGLLRIQMEVGANPTPFERRPFGLELALCQRYFEKTFPLEMTPAQNAGASAVSFTSRFIANKAGAVQNLSHDFPFVVRKRVTPTIVTFNPAAANAQFRDVSANVDTSGVVANATTRSIYFAATGNAVTAVGNALDVGWTASSEL